MANRPTPEKGKKEEGKGSKRERGGIRKKEKQKELRGFLHMGRLRNDTICLHIGERVFSKVGRNYSIG